MDRQVHVVEYPFVGLHFKLALVCVSSCLSCVSTYVVVEELESTSALPRQLGVQEAPLSIVR
jgi:hypothetical protein